MKNILKNVVYAVLSLFNHRGAVVLMYHSIGENGEFFTVSPEEFSRQMKYLRENNFNVISLENLVKTLMDRVSFPPKTVAVTFDDGYEDNYTEALPVLKRYNIPATIFLSVAEIGGTVPARKGASLKMMSIEQVKETKKSGLVSFGSHSNRHIKLSELGEKEAEEEVGSSRKILGSVLGENPAAIAYPFGAVNDSVEIAARKFFTAGFGIGKGRVREGDNPFLLKRNSVDSEVSFTQFKGIAVFGRV